VAVDIRVVVANRPGTSLALLDALAAEGVSLRGFSGDIRPGEKWGFLHVLVNDPDHDAARSVVLRQGLEITSEHQVELVDIEDVPGAVADAVRGYVEAGRNILVLYMGANSKLVVGPEDMQKPRYGIRTEDAK
jgi:hypothetical protein